MIDKQSLIFACSFVSTILSLLGWLCVSYLSPNPHICLLSIPIIIFIGIVEIYIMTKVL